MKTKFPHISAKARLTHSRSTIFAQVFSRSVAEVKPGGRDEARSRSPGIVMVSPGRESQGGISKVVENYARTSFWTEFRCVAFASTADLDSTWAKAFHGFGRILKFTASLIRGPRPWAVSIHTSHGGSFYRKFAYLAICRLFRVPVVLHIHPAHFLQFCATGGAARRLAVRLAGRWSDRIVVLSESIKRQLAEVVPGTELTVLGNPVDLAQYAPPLAVRAARPRILFLGWIVPEKGVYDLAAAIPAVLKAFPDALFTFAGNKEVEKLATLLHQRGLSESTEVLGWVEGQRKVELLRSSWILVLPSYTEGLPNVILEAMASELPIIATPVGGIPSVLSDGKTALFVEPGDVSGIAAMINRLLKDHTLRAALAAAAYARVRANYSVEVIDRELRQIYGRYRRISQ